MTAYLTRRQLGILAGLIGLAGCGNNDPFGNSPGSPGATGGSAAGRALVVGSQQYYSNQIIAELYAQTLESAGFRVDRQYQIGQREIYLPELAAGRIDVLPEYGGNLLQHYDKQTTARDADQIQAALTDVLPDGLRVLSPAEATDQDTYTVTGAFAKEYRLGSLADLAHVDQPLKVAANSEFGSRPYGPAGLQATYGVSVELVPVEDSGGPLTVRALTDGTVQLANIYSADPAIAREGLVSLADPQNLILPQHITPLVSRRVDTAAAEAIERVNDRLTTQDLIELNTRSVNEQLGAAQIVSDWLARRSK